MAWLGRQSTSGRRHSVGGAGQQNSLRDALRARGGAQNLPRATTDVEDNDDIPVKSSLDWLSLNPFAPKAMQGVVDRLKATGEGAMVRIKAGIGEDAVDRIKAGGTGAFDRIKAGAGAVLGGGEYSAEDGLSFSPPRRHGDHDSASSSEANGRQSTSGRKSTSLRSALQARGGIGRKSVGSSQPPEASDPVEEHPQNVDDAANEQIQENDDQPGLEKAFSSPLPAVREDDEEESPQHEQASDDVMEPPRQEEKEVEKEEDVVEDTETNQSEGRAEEPDQCMNEEPPHRERGEEVCASPAAEAEAEIAQAAEAARETEVLGADTTSAEVGGLETAVHDMSLNEESVHVVAPDTARTETENHKPPARRSRPSLHSAPQAPVPPPYVSKNLDEHAVVVQRQEPKAEPEEPSGPPLLASATYLRRPEKESQDVGKLKELREFWGSKKSKGFAGPELGSSRLSKNEAQATLQRLIAAGGDFDEVRRLRKLIQELDQ